jgi:hypothetical protein
MTRAAMSRLGMVVSVGLLVAPAGCITSGSGGSTSRSGPITVEEVRASAARNGYDLVQSLRPQWLRGRGATSLRSTEPTLPVVYVEGIREGATDSLRRIGTDVIARVEYLGASDATNRYGTGHTGGVILVSLRR